ncbi:hypothetical protein Tco_1524929 [Tanacetum coccineum]
MKASASSKSRKSLSSKGVSVGDEVETIGSSAKEVVRKAGRYDIWERFNTAYRGYSAWAARLLYSRIFFNHLPIWRIDASGYGVLGSSRHGYLVKLGREYAVFA